MPLALMELTITVTKGRPLRASIRALSVMLMSGTLTGIPIAFGPSPLLATRTTITVVVEPTMPRPVAVQGRLIVIPCTSIRLGVMPVLPLALVAAPVPRSIGGTSRKSVAVRAVPSPNRRKARSIHNRSHCTVSSGLVHVRRPALSRPNVVSVGLSSNRRTP